MEGAAHSCFFRPAPTGSSVAVLRTHVSSIGYAVAYPPYHVASLSFSSLLTLTLQHMEPTEFRALRVHLGVRQLWVVDGARAECVLLNGESPLKFDLGSGMISAVYEVRDEDGETVLARATSKELFMREDWTTREQALVPRPAVFDDDDRLAARRSVDFNIDYALYCVDDLWFVDAPAVPFWQALGIPFLAMNESIVANWYHTTPIHPQLVAQWRDMRDLVRHTTEAEALATRIQQRAGSAKRRRVGVADADVGVDDDNVDG